MNTSTLLRLDPQASNKRFKDIVDREMTELTAALTAAWLQWALQESGLSEDVFQVEVDAGRLVLLPEGPYTCLCVPDAAEGCYRALAYGQLQKTRTSWYLETVARKDFTDTRQVVWGPAVYK
jgi:hypothetical protein